MYRIISRTEGNAYRKLDSSYFMILPKYSEIATTSFLDVNKIILSNKKEHINTNINISNILDIIINEELYKK